MYVGVYVKVPLLGANGLQTIFQKHASSKKCPDTLHENQISMTWFHGAPHIYSLSHPTKALVSFLSQLCFPSQNTLVPSILVVCVPAGKSFLPKPAWSVLSSFNIYQIQWHLGSFHTIKPPVYSGFSLTMDIFLL